MILKLKSSVIAIFSTIIMLQMGFVAMATSGNMPDKVPAVTEKPTTNRGVASWYHDKFQGRKTASGEIFSQQKFTCASNKYPLGTWLRITNVRNGKVVLVKVNDRMHPRMNRVVDLSRIAAQTIGIEKAGVGTVEVENMGKTKPLISS